MENTTKSVGNMPSRVPSSAKSPQAELVKAPSPTPGSAALDLLVTGSTPTPARQNTAVAGKGSLADVAMFDADGNGTLDKEELNEMKNFRDVQKDSRDKRREAEALKRF